MQEIWKPITGFDNFYMISNEGRIVSLRNGSKKILSPSLSNSGYLHVQLYNKSGSSTLTVHSLVAKAFVSNPSNKKYVNHIDGNKQNNNASNLEWVTPKENHRHAKKMGLIPTSYILGRKGKQHPASKPILQYSIDGVFLREWDSVITASNYYEIHPSNIYSCVNGYHKSSNGYIWRKKTSETYPMKIDNVLLIQKKNSKNKKTIKRKKGIVNAITVPINQYTVDGIFIKRWESLSEVSRSIGYSRYKINQCCKGYTDILAGYVWKYAET